MVAKTSACLPPSSPKLARFWNLVDWRIIREWIVKFLLLLTIALLMLSAVMREHTSTQPLLPRACISSSKRKHDKAPRKIHEAEREPSDKVPRKIHKAKREKQKRDNMNVLFAELAKVLDPSHQNYGKACILKETMRLVRELIVQVDNLRKENAALNSESHYMTVEKDELKEEKIALEAQIENLQTEINETIRSQTTNIDNITSPPQLTEDHLRTSIHDYASSSAAATGPVLVVPLHNDLQMYSTADNAEALQNLPPSVSRPRPRYPSPSDSWPSRVLNVASTTTEDS